MKELERLHLEERTVALLIDRPLLSLIDKQA